MPDARSGIAPGRRPWAWVLLALAVCSAVAIATHGLRLVPPALDLPGPWIWVVRLAGAGAVAAGVGALLRERRKILAQGARGPDPTVVAVRTAATVMALLAVVALTVNPLALGRGLPGGGPSFSFGGSPRAGNGRLGLPGAQSGSMAGNASMGGGPSELSDAGLDVTVPGEDGFLGSPLQRIARSILPLLLLLVAALAFRAMTRRPTLQFEIMLDPPVARTAAEAGLAASLVEMAGGHPDPRHQITAAYRRLLVALSEAGAPRRPQEAPHEYLNRVLRPLGVRPDALHRLTGLYVLAEFSERPITPGHRAAAAEALDASLSDLRARWGEPDATAGRATEAAR
jgi:hypothetical protein